jgi:isopentenyl-diphosphate Delta-isomerase
MPMPDITMDPNISYRKSDHIAVVTQLADMNFQDSFAPWHLRVQSLPQIHFNAINTTTQFLGATFAAPYMIPGMVGGIPQGNMYNDYLAQIASHHNIPLGLGSQKIQILNQDPHCFGNLKQKYPSLFLIGNIGIGLLPHITIDQVLDLIRWEKFKNCLKLKEIAILGTHKTPYKNYCPISLSL